MQSPISLLLNHLGELHNDLTLSKEHMDNAWKRFWEIKIEILGLKEEMEKEREESGTD